MSFESNTTPAYGPSNTSAHESGAWSSNFSVCPYIAMIRTGVGKLIAVGEEAKQVLLKTTRVVDRIVRGLVLVTAAMDAVMCGTDVGHQRLFSQRASGGESALDEVRAALKAFSSGVQAAK